MEIKNSVLLLAFFITVGIFVLFLILGFTMDNKRLNALDERFDEMQNHINDIQQLMLMADVYGDEMTCLGFETKIKELDTTIWNLGIKLDQYKNAAEEFQKDPYYEKQKKLFNQQELIYLVLLNKINKKCYINPGIGNPLIITFFYGSSKNCAKCDDQAFVLTDINVELDEYISIFSFDTELNLTGVEAMMKYNKVDELPCIILDDEKFCGIRDKEFVIEQICKRKETPLCK